MLAQKSKFYCALLKIKEIVKMKQNAILHQMSSYYISQSGTKTVRDKWLTAFLDYSDM